MILILASTLLAVTPPKSPGEIFVCSRSLSYEDQYCAAVTQGRRWGHAEAAEAHELRARYAIPYEGTAHYLAAANNWIAAGEPGKAVIAFDRALAAGLEGDERRNVLVARDRAQAAHELRLKRLGAGATRE